MKKIMTCISIESKKLFHSKIPLITTLALTLIPFAGGFFMFMLKNPDVSKSLGIVSTKVEIMGSGDWTFYFSFLSQAISIGGILAFGFVTSWIFGREYSDRTIKDLLALPISRSIIVFSKFIVVFLWCFMLSIYILLLSLVVGFIIDIPELTIRLLMEGVSTYIICSLLTIFLSAPVGFFASFGRGYLSPLGFIVITLILAQLVAAIGYGEFLPWSIPFLIAIGIGDSSTIIKGFSIMIVLLMGLLGILSTMFWWKYVDQD